MKPTDEMTAPELLAELEASVGLDLLSERFTRREKRVHMLGMVQRVRMRQERRAAEKPVCVLLPKSTCYACRKIVRKGKGEGLGLYGEWVLVHKAGGCAAVVQTLRRRERLKPQPERTTHLPTGYTPSPSMSWTGEGGGFVNVVTNLDPITCERCDGEVPVEAGLIVRHEGERDDYHVTCAPNAARALMGLPPLKGRGESPSCAHPQDVHGEHDHDACEDAS